MATVTLTLRGVAPYDGRYDIDLAESEFTNREWGWIKRFSGYLPATFDDAVRGGDAEFWCVFALILLHRQHRITKADVAEVFELLQDAPYAAVAVEIDVHDEGDAGPPPRSSNGNEPTAGPFSSASSDSPATPQSPTGTPGSGTSVSVPVTSAS